eukprot:9469236-Pyramimonas_sp.AAC.4
MRQHNKHAQSVLQVGRVLNAPRETAEDSGVGVDSDTRSHIPSNSAHLATNKEPVYKVEAYRRADHLQATKWSLAICYFVEEQLRIYVVIALSRLRHTYEFSEIA